MFNKNKEFIVLEDSQQKELSSEVIDTKMSNSE